MSTDEIPVRKLICNIADMLADVKGALPKDIVAIIKNKPKGGAEAALDAESRYEAAVVKALIGQEVFDDFRSDQVPQNLWCAAILSNLTSRHPKITEWTREMAEVLPRATLEYFDSIPSMDRDDAYYQTFGIASCFQGGNVRAAELENQAKQKAPHMQV